MGRARRDRGVARDARGAGAGRGCRSAREVGCETGDEGRQGCDEAGCEGPREGPAYRGDSGQGASQRQAPREGERLTFSSSDVLAIVFGVVGLAWGVVSDRIGARWPAHEDGSVRRVDWRTLVTALVGGAAMAALPGRFTEPVHLGLFGGYFLALTLLLATDLDQRLLPDVITCSP